MFRHWNSKLLVKKNEISRILGHSKKKLVSHHFFPKNPIRHAVFLFFPDRNIKNTSLFCNLHILYLHLSNNKCSKRCNIVICQTDRCPGQKGGYEGFENFWNFRWKIVHITIKKSLKSLKKKFNAAHILDSWRSRWWEIKVFLEWPYSLYCIFILQVCKVHRRPNDTVLHW